MLKFFKIYLVILLWALFVISGLFCTDTALHLISAPSTPDVILGLFLILVYIHMFVGVVYATVKSVS